MAKIVFLMINAISFGKQIAACIAQTFIGFGLVLILNSCLIEVVIVNQTIFAIYVMIFLQEYSIYTLILSFLRYR